MSQSLNLTLTGEGAMESTGRLQDIAAAANAATIREHELTNIRALRKYWKGLAWAFFISLGIVLCGFDVAVSVSLIANPVFQEQYGYEYDPVNAPGSYIISLPWQLAVYLGLNSVQIFGATLGGFSADVVGRKIPFYICLLGNLGFNFLEMFGTSIGIIFIGSFLNGLCFGFYFVLAPTYAAEVVPYHLRHIAIAFTNMSLSLGQLLGSAAATTSLVRADDYAYRIPFATQWVFVVILLVGLIWCPESPYYLVHKGDITGAERTLTKLAIAEDPEDLPHLVAQIEKVNLLEKANLESTSYLECFKRTDVRRTEIATIPLVIYIISCVNLASSFTFFLEIAGLDANSAYDLTLGSYAIGVVATLLSYPLLMYVGRRPAFLWGSLAATVLLCIIGFLDLAPNYEEKDSYAWAQGIILILVAAVTSLTSGPAAWVIMSETPSTRLRSKTVSFAVAMEIVFSTPQTAFLLYQINETELNWRGKTCFFYGGLAFLGLVWAFFRLPELKGRTYEEIDILFQNNVSTWKFTKYQIEFDSREMVGKLESSKHC